MSLVMVWCSQMFTQGRLEIHQIINYVMLTVSRSQKRGRNFRVSCGRDLRRKTVRRLTYQIAALEHASMVIATCQRQYSRTCGDAFVTESTAFKADFLGLITGDSCS